MWPPLRCSECSDDMFYDKYIDADDGRGERPICVDCSQYVEMKGLSSNEQYTETNYWKSMGPGNYIAGYYSDVDHISRRISNMATDGSFIRSFQMADRLDRFKEDRSRDRLASSDPES